MTQDKYEKPHTIPTKELKSGTGRVFRHTGDRRSAPDIDLRKEENMKKAFYSTFPELNKKKDIYYE